MRKLILTAFMATTTLLAQGGAGGAGNATTPR
jgi:hypothetical protein